MNCCWIYRTAAGLWLGEQSHWPPWLRRHLEHCAHCHKQLEAQRQTAQILAAASHATPDCPPFLAARIKARLAAQARIPIRWYERPWARASAWAAACLLLLGLAAVRFTPTLLTRNPAPQLATGVADLLTVKPFGDNDLPRLGSALEQPLQSEIELAMEDGRRALAGLVENFVPAPLAPAPLPQQK
jgi:hypothetical protein